MCFLFFFGSQWRACIIDQLSVIQNPDTFNQLINTSHVKYSIEEKTLTIRFHFKIPEDFSRLDFYTGFVTLQNLNHSLKIDDDN